MSSEFRQHANWSTQISTTFICHLCNIKYISTVLLAVHQTYLDKPGYVTFCKQRKQEAQSVTGIMYLLCLHSEQHLIHFNQCCADVMPSTEHTYM